MYVRRRVSQAHAWSHEQGRLVFCAIALIYSKKIHLLIRIINCSCFPSTQRSQFVINDRDINCRWRNNEKIEIKKGVDIVMMIK